MRDERHERHQPLTDDTRDAEVVTAAEMRDNGTTRGTVTERYEAPPRGAAVIREPVRVEDEAEPVGERELEIPSAYNLARDRVRWGPIWAGLLAALTALVLLSLLGLAIGLTAVDAAQAARQGGPPPATGWVAAVWGAVSAILAFLAGGYLAGWTAAVFNRRWGALNGALVFLLAVPLVLLLTGMGLGTILGTLGHYAGALNVDLGQLRGAASQAGQAAQAVQQGDVGRAAANARNGAWGALLGVLLGLVASALGGALGTRREVEVERGTGDVID